MKIDEKIHIWNSEGPYNLFSICGEEKENVDYDDKKMFACEIGFERNKIFESILKTGVFDENRENLCGKCIEIDFHGDNIFGEYCDGAFK